MPVFSFSLRTAQASRRYDGILLPFVAGDLAMLLPEVAADKRPFKEVTMTRASLANGQVLYAVNELFIGARSHTSAIYEIAADGRKETQSSSGLIVSTVSARPPSSRAVVTASLAVAGAFGSQAQAETHQPQPWDSGELRFAVREPFPSKISQVGLVYGRVTNAEQLRIRSLMPENSVIFSDGIEADRLKFNSGTEAQITVADRLGRLIV